MAVPTVTVSGTAVSTDAAGTPIAANLTGGVAGDIAVVFIALDQNLPATITANGSGWTKRADVVSYALAWPDDTNTGVQSASLTTVNLTGTLWRASTDGANIASTTEVIGGQTYVVYTQFDFVSTTQYLYLDVPYIKFVRCRFTASGVVNNTGAVVQGTSTMNAVIVEDCTFDGGFSNRNRGLHSDHGDITVRRSRLTHCGEAAVEKNDTTGLWSVEVSDSFITEDQLWPPGQHVDGLQMGGGRSFTARHNTILIAPYGGSNTDQTYVSNSCIGLFAELGHFTGDVTIDNNIVAGGGACFYIQEKASFHFQGAVNATANVIWRSLNGNIPGGAVFFVLYPNGLPPALNWSANAYDDGTSLSLAQAKAPI